MMKLSFPQAPLAYTEPLEQFPARSFPRVLMSTNEYYRFLQRHPFRGYGWHGAVDRARMGRGQLKITIQ